MEPLSSDDPRAVGEFRLRARLGAGGMGRVYLGRSPAGRAVAVKVVHPELARDAEFIGRFRSEVAAAQAVNGIYTAQVVAAGLYDTPPWLATAYVPGPTLQQLVDERGSLPEQAVWRLAGGLAEALQAVHGAGLVHRDLKPNNVLIAEDGPRVIDFGVSRALDGASATRTGLTFGTPPFMSPEQAKGQAVGAPSDVFSLGSVLCFAVTGHPPFGDGNAPAVLYRVVHEEPALGGVRGVLLDLITGCLAKQAADRPTLPQIVASLAARTDGWDGRFWPAGVLGVIRDYVGIDLNGLASTPVPARQSAIGPLTGARDATHGSFAAAPTSTQLAAPAARTVSPAVSPAVQPDPSPSRPDPSPSRPDPSPAGPAPGISRRRTLAIAGGVGGVIVAGSVTGWALDRPGLKPRPALHRTRFRDTSRRRAHCAGRAPGCQRRWPPRWAPAWLHSRRVAVTCRPTARLPADSCGTTCRLAWRWSRRRTTWSSPPDGTVPSAYWDSMAPPASRCGAPPATRTSREWPWAAACASFPPRPAGQRSSRMT
ncbi:MAG TPA: serine/threonine-protein kinase [Streptosporangiaceae bacterium]